MHKKAITLALLAASVAAVATTVKPVKVTRLDPAIVQTAAATQAAITPVAAATVAQAPAVSPAISQAVSRWRSLRQTDGLPFTSYASFLTSYRGWPGEDAMRRTAERAIDLNSNPREVANYFRTMPPLTNVGHARHAFALQATGQTGEAVEAARRAWQGGVLPRGDEERLLALFGASLGPQDHERRLDKLFAHGDLESARRTLGFYAGPRRAVFDAQLALQSQAPDAMSRVNALAAANREPGLLIDRANWLRNTSQPAAARALLAQPRTLTVRPGDVDKFYETLLVMARGAANDRQWTTAYQIASQVDDAYPPGTDVSAQSYGERDKYTDLVWLAGTTAFFQLNRPSDAIGMFERYARAARSPQTQTKGYYWAGRAATQAGQAQRATQYFTDAAQHSDSFYGQLALERLGRPVPQPQVTSGAAPTAAQRAAFASRDLVQATRLLGQTGQREDQSTFIRALAEQLTTEADRNLAGELARYIGRPDLGVWVAREARGNGATFYARSSFPDVPVPPAYARQWTLNHAIMRQESSFDRAAVSHAGARGMMQLMPGTARETAGKLGLSYDLSRLTGDPQYNIMLGSRYFSDLMNRYGNYAPLAVAAYNAGPGNVNKWLRENGDPRTPGIDVVRWIEEIPFFETRNYVHRVLENAVVYDTINPNGAHSPANMRLSYYLGKRQPG